MTAPSGGHLTSLPSGFPYTGMQVEQGQVLACLAPILGGETDVVERLAHRVAPATRHLGLEKVLVRLNLLDREAPERPAQETEIVISGMDNQKVGQVSAEIRAFRPPEPYKGKGVRYAEERVRRKEAKKK